MSQNRTRWITALMGLMVGAPLVKLLSRGDAFLVWPKAVYSDLLTAHLPLSSFVHQALLHWGRLPLWNPTVFGGQPLIGDPLAGLTYPPYWLTFLWPSAAAFQLLFVIHLVWAGFGAYRLGRRFGLRPLAASLTAVAFAGTPRLWGHWGLGHVTLVFAICWTPWVLLALESAIAASLEGIDWLRFGLAGAVLGLLASADPRWAPPAGLLALLYFLWRIAYSHQGTRVRVGRIGGFSLMVVGALGTSAWLLLPLLEFASYSTRAGLSAVELARMSLPPAALLGTVLPDPGAWPEQVASVGVVVMLLAAVGLVARRHPATLFWVSVTVVGWLVALGPATPLYGIIEVAPGMSLVRVPARWAAVSSFSLAILAGIGFDAILPGEDVSDWRVPGRLLLSGFLAFTGILLAAVVIWIQPSVLLQRPGWLLALIWASLGTWLLFRRLSPVRSGLAAVVLVLLVPLELGVYNWQSVQSRAMPSDRSAEVGRPARRWGESRLLLTSYNLPQLSAVQRQIELAGGVGPLHLESYWAFMADALGFALDKYSVTLPPYPLGDPMVPGELSLPAERLGWLNITEIAVPQSTDVAGLQLVGPWRGSWLYTNQLARPRAWIQDSTGSDITGAWREVDQIEWQPNRIEVMALGPGRLVLAETTYPGWTATVDGDRVGIEPAAGFLRSIELPAGAHIVVFRFIPWNAILGLTLTALTWLALVIMWWRR